MTNLRPLIMRRIYLEYVRRQAVSTLLSPLFAFAAFTVLLSLSVSVPNIVWNLMRTSPESMLNFWVVAIRDTQWLVRFVILGIGLSLAVNLRPLFNNAFNRVRIIAFERRTV